MNSTASNRLGAIARSSEGRIFPCIEYGQLELPFDELFSHGRLSIYPEVMERGYFTVGSVGGNILLRAGGFVGLIQLNPELAVFVEPRIPIERLTELIVRSGKLPKQLSTTSRQYGKGSLPLSLILRPLTEALLNSIDPLRINGLFRDFVREDEDTSSPKGHINLHQTISRFRTKKIDHIVSISRYRQTLNNAPNQCIKYAIWLISLMYQKAPGGIPPELGQRLNTAFRLFNQVELDSSLEFLSDNFVKDPSTLPLKRSYYRDALDLSKQLISNEGLELESLTGNTRMASLIFNMSSVYEEYVRNVLNSASALGGPLKPYLMEIKIRPLAQKKHYFAKAHISHTWPSPTSYCATVQEITWRYSILNTNQVSDLMKTTFTKSCLMRAHLIVKRRSLYTLL